MSNSIKPMTNIKISSIDDPTLFVVVKDKFANGSNIIVSTSGTYNTWNYNSDGTISSTYDPNYIIVASGVTKPSAIILADTRVTGTTYSKWIYDPTNQTFTLSSGGPNNLMVINKSLTSGMNLIVDTAGTYDQWKITYVPPPPFPNIPNTSNEAILIYLSSSSSILSIFASGCCLFLIILFVLMRKKK